MPFYLRSKDTTALILVNVIPLRDGVWKRRFAYLSLGLRTDLQAMTLPIIIATTAVLHNIAMLRNDVEDFDVDINVDADVNNIFVGENNSVRTAVINFFR
ncbi:hypothetical protein NQ314_016123 [Rhamnusium bicolor]|uniref:DDE Tnp4 domain-containing protein n=1 Tax=Rhamnusium bicolor TaxID=1586634 RepID=A0AAV8WX03_9CUCU|nr:hypothetical protein NQ314_016123 [Rhamnusium bicolor]